MNGLFAQTFQCEVNPIPLTIDGQAVQAPFAGGLTLSKPAGADIDDDGDLDLFVAQADGGPLFYRNVTTTEVPFPPATGAPQSFDLKQNYPNPFNPATTIDYQLPQSTQVKLAIYNLLGQPVATLVKRVQPSGSYSVQ